MMIQLQSLTMQLDNLYLLLDEAKANDKPLDEINRIIGQIKEVRRLIEKRKAFLRRHEYRN